MDRVPSSEVQLSEADDHMVELIGRVEKGEEIIFVRDGKAAAKLVPLNQSEATDASQPPRPRRLGLAKGLIWVADDFDETPDWVIDAFHGLDADKPLPEEALRDIEAAEARRAKSRS